ncbi:PREDICTED: 39S ribosomal protein L27, mitochondrial [Thamnophis sirtalis]|uniref:Large ribosomal subunit protein bL27m n=1 Tax=Thamnophis sirtalis TaxID=35019 RepID=A0A6I9YUE5_9SAUR|nr:PREDICTED: 39S ribosomal protein L27, mitochondrial [Thamnophis sirtalis]
MLKTVALLYLSICIQLKCIQAVLFLRFTFFNSFAGQFVHAGNILATQRVFRWHPGAHVGMGYNKWLYALEDGIVRFTKEIYVPPPRSKESREVICRLPKGSVLYKTFINVVPTEEVGRFKLITMI